MALVSFDTGIKQIRGKSGRINFAQTKYGIEYKSNPIRTKPQSSAQLAQQARIKRAAAAFNALTASQNTAWQTYASSQTVMSKSGNPVHLSAYAAFVALYTKFLQASPGLLFPTAPPAASFGGDSVIVTPSATSGKITFTASKANAANVTTELLIQPLKNVYRKPTSSYTSQAFFAFTASTLSTFVNVTPGPYSVAIRFVNSTTGQEVSKVVLGTVNAA